jgi:hypothetical protein
MAQVFLPQRTQVATSATTNGGGTNAEHAGRWQYVRSGVSISAFLARNLPASVAERSGRQPSSAIARPQHRGGNSDSSVSDSVNSVARHSRQ